MALPETINTGMRFKTFIDAYLAERYNSSIKHNDIVYPIYKDISSNELDDVLKEDGYGGARFGVVNPSTIYGWNVDLIHHRVEKSLHVKFWLKMDYVRGRTYMSLAEYTDVELFKNNFGGTLSKKFKDILPSKVVAIKDIDENIVWTWEK